MSEQEYTNDDTLPIRLPCMRRETYRDVQPGESVWGEHTPRRSVSIFESIDPSNPEGLQRFRSLTVNDRFYIPLQAYDEDDEPREDTLYMAEYRVKSLDLGEGAPSVLHC